MSEAFEKALAAKERGAARARAREEKREQLAKTGQLRLSKQPSVEKLDGLWALVVKMRDKKTSPWCRICWKRPGTVAYHILTKQRGRSIRWRLDNGVLACAPCNNGERLNRSLYRDKHIALFGKELVENLEAVAGVAPKVDEFTVYSELSIALKALGMQPV